MDQPISDCQQQLSANPADAMAAARIDAGIVTMVLLGHPPHRRQNDLAVQIGRTTPSPERI